MWEGQTMRTLASSVPHLIILMFKCFTAGTSQRFAGLAKFFPKLLDWLEISVLDLARSQILYISVSTSEVTLSFSHDTRNAMST